MNNTARALITVGLILLGVALVMLFGVSYSQVQQPCTIDTNTTNTTNPIMNALKDLFGDTK